VRCEGSEFDIECELIVSAIGQGVDAEGMDDSFFTTPSRFASSISSCAAGIFSTVERVVSSTSEIWPDKEGYYCTSLASNPIGFTPKYYFIFPLKRGHPSYKDTFFITEGVALYKSVTNVSSILILFF
jgi:hypothetical protein